MSEGPKVKEVKDNTKEWRSSLGSHKTASSSLSSGKGGVSKGTKGEASPKVNKKTAAKTFGRQGMNGTDMEVANTATGTTPKEESVSQGPTANGEKAGASARGPSAPGRSSGRQQSPRGIGYSI